MSSDIESTFITAAAASAAAISIAAGVGNNAALTLTASPYVTDAARKITITSAGDDDAISFTIVGLDHLGNAATENLVGANAAVATSVGYWTSITSILVGPISYFGNVRFTTMPHVHRRFLYPTYAVLTRRRHSEMKSLWYDALQKPIG